jgi:hypothetical protein
MVRRATARKASGERQVCGNVFVNKGEGVVKDKHILFVAWSNALSQGFRDQARAEPPRITFRCRPCVVVESQVSNARPGPPACLLIPDQVSWHAAHPTPCLHPADPHLCKMWGTLSTPQRLILRSGATPPRASVPPPAHEGVNSSCSLGGQFFMMLRHPETWRDHIHLLKVLHQHLRLLRWVDKDQR